MRHMAVERRIRPVGDPWHMAVFHGVPVHVIDIPAKIDVVSNLVFPISPLPYPAFAFRHPAFVTSLTRRDPSRKSRLDQHPPHGVVAIAHWQRPNGAETIGQDHHGIEVQRMRRLDRPHHLPQCVHVVHEQGTCPLRQIAREEIRAPRHIRPAIPHSCHLQL